MGILIYYHLHVQSTYTASKYNTITTTSYVLCYYAVLYNRNSIQEQSDSGLDTIMQAPELTRVPRLFCKGQILAQVLRT